MSRAGKNTTRGKNRSGRNRSTTNALTTALRVTAQSLSRSRSVLGAFYRRKKAHLGAEKAINATAHKLARMIYFTIKNQRPYIDPGPASYTKHHRERLLKAMQKRAKLLGYELVKAA